MIRAALLVALALTAAVGCAAPSPAGSRDEDLRPAERKIIGAGVPYDADPALRPRTAELDGSMRARRTAAWKALAKVLRPVAVAEPGVKVEGAPTIPLFRTWYGKDDFERLFGKMYAELSPGERKERRAFTAAELAKGLAWNAGDQGSWSDEEYLARVKGVTDRAFLQGLGGNGRVSYSPGFVSHMLREYKTTFACLPKLADFGLLTPAPSETNFAQCFSEESPIDAALVKASWWRADLGTELPVYDTGRETLAARRSGATDEGGWGTGGGKANPDAARIYTIKTSDGSAYRMPAMHLATKELREWLWITTWWSDAPDTDFGADRPDEIRALGGPWSSYKMCVVSGYAEGDADPRGGYDGSLGDALAAVHEGRGGATWCSNPYVEKGAKNAQTNCIGCHQHAGSPSLGSAAILADAATFPRSGRTQLRKSFPSDYVWSFGAPPDFLARVVEAQVSHFDAIDR